MFEYSLNGHGGHLRWQITVVQLCHNQNINQDVAFPRWRLEQGPIKIQVYCRIICPRSEHQLYLLKRPNISRFFWLAEKMYER